MLSDEMTTGSVTSSEPHKRAFAAASHGWNITQQRFKDAFPDYCTPDLRDLPNMGIKERGKSDTPVQSPLFSIPASPIVQAPSTRFGLGTSPSAPIPAPSTPVNLIPTNLAGTSIVGKNDDMRRPAPGLVGTWGRLIWEKWRWGVLIALAVVVSRFSSS